MPGQRYSGRPVLSFGVMGGSYQPLGHAWVLSNWLDYGMDLQQAIDAPRFHLDSGKLRDERPVSPVTHQGLSRLGHDVVESEMPIGGVQMIGIDWQEGVLYGVPDPHKDGRAPGY